MSTLVTLRPNTATPTTISGSSGVTFTGAGTLIGAVTDASDASYAQQIGSSTDSSLAVYSGFTFAPAAGTQVRSVSPRYRADAPLGSNGDTTRIFFKLGDDTGQQGAEAIPATSGITNVTPISRTAKRDGTPWDVAGVVAASLSFRNGGSSAGTLKTYEVYLDVVYNLAPSATATGPSGSTNTSQPTITWTYSDPDSDAQERFRIKVFTAAQVAAGGFDPNTTTATLDSGEVFSAATSWTCTAPLTNGTSYQAYIFVADVGSSGRYNIVTSGGPYASFTIALVPPATPVVVATADVANARVQLALTTTDNLLSTDEADFEGGVGSWTATANCSVSQSTTLAELGTHSLRLSSSASGTITASTASGSSARPVVASTQYSFACDIRSGANSRSAQVVAFWYKANGTASSTPSSTGFLGSTVTGSWTTLFGAATSPADAAYMALQVQVLSTAGASELYYVDKAVLRPSNAFTYVPGGLLSLRHFAVQRSADGGTTWTTVARTPVNGALTTEDLSTYTIDPVTQAVIVYDYESPRGIALQYQVRSSAVVSGIGTIVSPWSSGSSVTLTRDFQTWIKDPIDPSRNIAAVMDQHSLIKTREEAQGVHYAMGRPDPIVVHGTVRLSTYGVQLFFQNDAQHNAWVVLRDSQRTLFMQTGYGELSGESYYFSIDSSVSTEAITLDTMRTAQPRRASFVARETVSP